MVFCYISTFHDTTQEDPNLEKYLTSSSSLYGNVSDLILIFATRCSYQNVLLQKDADARSIG